MSVIDFRVIEQSKPIDRYLLLDIFHLDNIRFSRRVNSDDHNWWELNSISLETVQDYFAPVLEEEVLAEHISDAKSDGFVVHLNRISYKKSYKKANLWLADIHDGHIDLIREMGWDVYFYIGRNPQYWISKKFIEHSKRLKLNIYAFDMKKISF